MTTAAPATINRIINTPGIYTGLTFEEYAAIPAVSRTLLVKLASTPADALAFMQGPGETTKSLEFGIGAHCLMLEPERFATEFAIGPDVKLNTAEGRTEWTRFSCQHRGKRLIRGADGRDLMGMRDRLFQHPLANLLMRAPGTNEVVFVWRDKATSLLCKVRIDRFFSWDGQAAALDFKSTSDASKSGFPRSYGDFLYYLQEAFYTDGIVAATAEPLPNFFILAQEKTNPYRANVFRFASHRVQQGRQLYHDLLEVYAACMKSNHWPAIDGREYLAEVIEADVPAFSMKDAE